MNHAISKKSATPLFLALSISLVRQLVNEMFHLSNEKFALEIKVADYEAFMRSPYTRRSDMF